MVTRKKNYKNNPKIIQMIALAGKNIKTVIYLYSICLRSKRKDLGHEKRHKRFRKTQIEILEIKLQYLKLKMYSMG